MLLYVTHCAMLTSMLHADILLQAQHAECRATELQNPRNDATSCFDLLCEMDSMVPNKGRDCR